MRVLLLGPVTFAGDDGIEHRVAGKPAALVTALALEAGSAVDRADLVEALWGASPPPTARNTLQAHVSAVRRLVGADLVERVGTGYRLALAPKDVDALDFVRGVERAQEHDDAGEQAAASRVLRAALALWRGVPFAGLDTPWLEAQRTRLQRLNELAELMRLDGDLALGRHRQALDELLALAGARPLDECVAERLMLALYRSGRQGDALDVYTRIREDLLEQLGVEPGPTLRERHRAVLQQSPALDVPDGVLPTLRP